MKLEYVPLLQVQRELQGMPRGYDRFRQYLRTIIGDDGLKLPPLGIMNPMGKDHVTDLLDALFAMGADAIAERAVTEAAAVLANVSGEAKVTLVVADDLKGGWTNRYDYEFNLRFGRASGHFDRDPDSPSGFRLPRWTKHFWLTGVLWSSEEPSKQAIREAVLLPAHRLAYTIHHGPAHTLGDMVAQEGRVMAATGCSRPALEADDIEYTREVLVPFLDADDKRTAIECLFGDEAGRTLGFTPRGLSHWAGLALALHDARLADVRR